MPEEKITEQSGETTPSFFDQIYDKIENVIGGNNPNQYLCLTIPGQALTAEDFAYDYKNNAPKGPTIEANESRLANKLFDPCHVTGSDSGMTLPYQYRMALDNLAPKLNARIAQAKIELRELLLTPYPYDFGDGENTTYTLQEVFYRLYDEYVEAEQKWSEMQNAETQRLLSLYPGSDIKSNTQRKDQYLTWYETVSKGELTALNEKRAKVLSVFSPNDMEILNGILDSGSGAEIEKARETLINTEKISPNGGTIYPVSFQPTNWFELLDTSFTPVDLLESPTALSTRLQSLSVRRVSLSARIEELSSLLVDDATIKSKQAAVAEHRQNLNTAQNALVKQYGEGVKSILSAAIDLAPIFVGGLSLDMVDKLAGGTELSSGQTPADLVEKLNECVAASSSSQTQLIDSAQDLCDSMMDVVTSAGMNELSAVLSPLKEQLTNINNSIDSVKEKISMSKAVVMSSDGDESGRKGSISDVTPPEIPAGYSQIIIEADTSTMDTETKKHASASSSNTGVSFWFAGCSHRKDSSESDFKTAKESTNSKVRIGMNIAKVGIEREWFNPGVFVLSKDTFRVSNSSIAPVPNDTFITNARLEEMSNDYILPCYPVAMLIARDVSIQISYDSSASQSFTRSIEQHASTGGGFLFFSGSSSSSSSSSESGAHTQFNSDGVTIRFDTPQIIGYYMEATPADRSSLIDNISQQSYDAGYVTINKFVSEYKSMIERLKR